MKSRTLTFAIGIVLLAKLATPFLLVAQKTSYKLIDIGTLGGPSAHGPGNGPGAQLINNAGEVAGSADTSLPCNGANCPIGHGFRWENGVLTDLGALSAQVNSSGANAINARGWIAGISQSAELDPVTGSPAGHAVLWKDNQPIDLGTLGTGVQSNGGYIDNGGAVVGVSTVDTTFDPFASFGPFSSPTHVFTWKDGIMRDLGTLGGLDSFIGINNGGCNNQRVDLVAGSSYVNTNANATTGLPTMHPFLWENGTLSDLGSLGGTFAVSQCANNQGQVIGQSNLPGDPGCDGSVFDGSCFQHAFLWDHGTLSDLGTLGGNFSVAIWLNNAAEAVGGATTPGDAEAHATLWKNGVITDLGTLDGDCFSQAWAINSKGQIVGQSFSCDFSTVRTVLWDKGSIIDLNIASTEPLNINDRGEITGVYLPDGCQDSDLCSHAFVLVPCNNAGVQGCDMVQPNPAAIATRTATPTPDPQKTRELVAKWRAHLAQRHTVLGTGRSRN